MEFRNGQDNRLCRGERYTDDVFTGSIRGTDLRNTIYQSFEFQDLDAREAIFIESDFIGLHFSRVDLRGTDLTRVKHLEEVTGLPTARFNDNTILDDVDLRPLALKDPEIAAKLRQIRRIGRVKRKHFLLYWTWRISCNCGRSPFLFALWALFLIVPVFGLMYWIGQLKPACIWLPHLTMTQDSNTSLCLWECLEFSSMTFTNYNFPGVEWYDTITGMWIAIEIWLGFAFLGVFVSLLAARLVRNE